MSQAPEDPAAGHKRQAAEAAASMVRDGMAVGLGTGSTAFFLIAALGRRVRDEGLRLRCIPTSERSAAQAREEGLDVLGFDSLQRLDLAIDGADEIEAPRLHLVKGLGGALLREKIVASAAARLVVIADASKLVGRLGTRAPVPVEVARFGWQATASRLRSLGVRPELRQADGAPFETDGGNLILDCRTDGIADPAALDRALREVVGVVETGLFIGLASEALVAGADGVQHLEAR